MESKFGTLENMTLTSENKVGALDNKVGQLEKKIGTLSNKLRTLEIKMGTLEKKKIKQVLFINLYLSIINFVLRESASPIANLLA